MESKRRLNFMDVLIILLIVVTVSGGIYFISRVVESNQKTEANVSNVKNVNIEYTVKIAETDNAVADLFVLAIENGEKLCLGDKECMETTVLEYAVKPAEKQVLDTQRGEMKISKIPNCTDITLTFKAHGTESDTEICSEIGAIRVGDEVRVSGKGFSGSGYVTDLKIVE